jgi:hypothetical protein
MTELTRLDPLRFASTKSWGFQIDDIACAPWAERFHDKVSILHMMKI